MKVVSVWEDDRKMNKSKLKPCPFCGCNEKYVAVIPRRTMIAKKDVKNVYQIICTKCGAKTGSRKTEKEAEKAWNRRTGNDQRRVITWQPLPEPYKETI